MNIMEVSRSNLEYKEEVCREFFKAIREVEFDKLCSRVKKLGLRVDQAWRAARGQGFKAVAARFMVDSEEVLVVAFRSTFGNDEWLEYPQKYWKRRFIVHDGEPASSKRCLFAHWNETLDEVWNLPGDEVGGVTDSLRSTIWRQLNTGNRVWLVGHSKGGAVATTAAARLLLGDSVVDAAMPDPATRRPEGRMATVAGCGLSRLSVFTFNAPMAFTPGLAEAYEARMAEVDAEHMRFEHKADRVRKLPMGDGLVHVGNRQLQGDGILEDRGVWWGGAIAVAGVVAALVSAGTKVVNSH